MNAAVHLIMFIFEKFGLGMSVRYAGFIFWSVRTVTGQTNKVKADNHRWEKPTVIEPRTRNSPERKSLQRQIVS